MRINLLYLIIILSNSTLFSQTSLLGVIRSAGKPVEYAIVKNINSKEFRYTDEQGKFSITNNSGKDTLLIECLGYITQKVVLSKELTKFDIELLQNSDVLDELTIFINSSQKSNWKKVNRKTRNMDFYRAIPEGSNLTTTYTVQEKITFNGIRFYLSLNPLKNDYKKKVRPILIVNSSNIQDNVLPNKIIHLENNNPEYSKIDIEFNQSIELLPNQTLTVGLELVPDDIMTPKIFNNVIGVLQTKHRLYKSNTMYNYLFSKDESIFQAVDQDILFELKVVE